MASQFDISKISDFLKRRSFRFAASISLSSPLNAVVVDVRSENIAKTVSKVATSRRQLQFLSQAAREEFGINLLFLESVEGREDLEGGLRFHLRNKLESERLECFVSLSSDGSARVWVDGVPALYAKEDVEGWVSSFLNAVGVSLVALDLIGFTENSPSNITILRSIKSEQPILIDDLRISLVKLGWDVPPGRWLSGELDKMRKKKFLLRRKDEKFVLTEAGLSSIPLVRTRKSSDIERALVLGRKKWND